MPPSPQEAYRPCRDRPQGPRSPPRSDQMGLERKPSPSRPPPMWSLTEVPPEREKQAQRFRHLRPVLPRRLPLSAGAWKPSAGCRRTSRYSTGQRGFWNGDHYPNDTERDLAMIVAGQRIETVKTNRRAFVAILMAL